MTTKLYILLSFASLCVVSMLFATSVSYAQQEQISIPNITPYWIHRAPYANATGLVLSKLHTQSSSQDQSFFATKNLATTIPSALGGLSILGGSLFTWFKVKQKGKIFATYMKKIEEAEQAFIQKKGKDKSSQAKAVKEFKDYLTNLQNDIDLATADKKIDEAQRTTLTHALERKSSQLI